MLTQRFVQGRGRRRGMSAVMAAGCLIGLVALGGCGGVFGSAGAGGVTIQSVGMEPVELAAQFQTAVYSVVDDTETAFLLTDIPSDELMAGEPESGQVLYVEMLWKPRPGSTPIDASATNVGITYIIFSGGEMGVYSGAGFAMPSGTTGRDGKGLTFRNATLKLDDATEGFVDPLSPARLRGAIRADHDERETRRLRFAVSQIMTNALDESRMLDRRGIDVGGRLADAAGRSWYTAGLCLPPLHQ